MTARIVAGFVSLLLVAGLVLGAGWQVLNGGGRWALTTVGEVVSTRAYGNP